MKEESLLALMRRAVREDLGRADARALNYPRVARELGIGQPRLKVLVRCGVLLGTTVGRIRMIPVSEVERFARLRPRPLHRS